MIETKADMLTPEELKPHLLNEDDEVREAVVRYFDESYHEDETLIPLILEACDRYGDSRNLRALAACRRLALTEEPFLDVVQRLQGARHPSVLLHLRRIIAKAPVELLMRHEPKVLDAIKLEREILEHIELRRRLAGWSGERLWEELRGYAERTRDKQYAGDIDHGYVDALIEALAPHHIPDGAAVCDLLRSADEHTGWMEIFLIDLAGQRRLHEAVPVLVPKFRIDTDYMLERCSDALARIGDPEAVRLIGESFPGESWGYKNYSSGLLGRIKHPQAEEVIIRLLASEPDPTIKTNLCISLCELFSRPGIEIVRQVIVNGSYDPMFAELKEDILPVIDVLAIDLPEADQWRRQRADTDRKAKAAERELEELVRRHPPTLRDPYPRWQPRPDPREWATATTTLRRAERAVGRNEPCPCGSGKKYKKCCGKG